MAAEGDEGGEGYGDEPWVGEVVEELPEVDEVVWGRPRAPEAVEEDGAAVVHLEVPRLLERRGEERADEAGLAEPREELLADVDVRDDLLMGIDISASKT